AVLPACLSLSSALSLNDTAALAPSLTAASMLPAIVLLPVVPVDSARAVRCVVAEGVAGAALPEIVVSDRAGSLRRRQQASPDAWMLLARSRAGARTNARIAR